MKTIIIFFCFYTCAFYAQDSSSVKNPSKWQVGINGSADFCYRTLKSDGSEFANQLTASYNNSDKPKAGYTTGISGVYNFNKTIGLQFGCLFSDKGFATKPIDLAVAAGTPPRRGFVYTNYTSVTSVQYTYHYYYLDIPLRINFFAGKRKLRFIGSAGIIANIFLKEATTAYLTYANGGHGLEKGNDVTNYNRINLSPMVSAGMNYRLTNKISLRLESFSSYGILKITDSLVNAYLWNAGINIGCYFNL